MLCSGVRIIYRLCCVGVVRCVIGVWCCERVRELVLVILFFCGFRSRCVDVFSCVLMFGV